MLVVALGKGARGLLLGNYGASTLVLLGLWWTMRDRLRPVTRVPRAERVRVLLRFGLPRCRPRRRCTRSASSTATTSSTTAAPALAGLYSIAVKLAGAVAFIVRAFQYAWPPLAYSVTR